jgi:hypothetical protein
MEERAGGRRFIQRIMLKEIPSLRLSPRSFLTEREGQQQIAGNLHPRK